MAPARPAVGHAIAGDTGPEVPARDAAQRRSRRAGREDLEGLELAVEVLADAQRPRARGARARRHHHRTAEAEVQGAGPALYALLLAEPVAGGKALRPAEREDHRALHGVHLGGEPAPDPGTGRLGQCDPDPGAGAQLEAPVARQRELEARTAAGVVAAEQHLPATVAHERRLRPEPQLHARGGRKARHRRRVREGSAVRGLHPARERRPGEPRLDLRDLEAGAGRVAVAVQEPQEPVVPGGLGRAQHEVHRLAGVRHERVDVADELGRVGAGHPAAA